ncbi:MAG: hypothetical protein FWE14_05560 [Lachnospiraceae bacterium]|nr:hypothetical protein [Lachnospiraceae bacterium]
MYKRKIVISLVLIFTLIIGNIPPFYVLSEEASYPQIELIEIDNDESESNDGFSNEDLEIDADSEVDDSLEDYSIDNLFISEETLELLEINVPEDIYYIPESDLPDEIMEHELDFISRFMDKEIDDISFYDTVYDVLGMPTYLLVEFHSGGYAIMLRTTARVMECTYSGRNPYWDFSSEKKVYVGALSYLLEVDGDITNFDGEIISDEVIEVLQEFQELILEDSLEVAEEAFAELIEQAEFMQAQMPFAELAQISSGLMSTSATCDKPIFTHSFSNTINRETILTQPFGYNTTEGGRYQGSCGPIASSMLLNYYSEQVHPNFVAENHKPTIENPDILHEILMKHTGISNGGTYPWDDRDGINSYLRSNLITSELGFYATTHYLLSAGGMIKDKLDAGKPAIVYIINVKDEEGSLNPDITDFHNHAVLAYDYKTIVETIHFWEGLFHPVNTLVNIHSGWHRYCDGYQDLERHKGQPHNHQDDLFISGIFGGPVWLEQCINHDLSNVILDVGEAKVCYRFTCNNCIMSYDAGHDFVLSDGSSGFHNPVCRECGYIGLGYNWVYQLQNSPFSDYIGLPIVKSENGGVIGTSGKSVLAGRPGYDDVITAGSSGDLIIGGPGNNTLKGGAGRDVFVFNLGDGQATIDCYSETESGRDIISFGAGISFSDLIMEPVTREIDGQESYDLEIKFGSGDDRIYISNYSLGDSYRPFAMHFSDGIVLLPKPFLRDVRETSSTPSMTNYRLYWDAVPGAAGYEVYRSTTYSEIYSKIATLNNGSATTYNDAVRKSDIIRYKIRAINGENHFSPYSNIFSIEIHEYFLKKNLNNRFGNSIEYGRKSFGIARRTVSPLIINLNGTGIETLSLNHGVYFDHMGTGFMVQTGWAGPTDGLLVRDINGDGRINSGRHLFGDNTMLKNGTLASNGFEALKDLDDNDDGIFDANDPMFHELYIWIDKNSNGIADPGELISLTEAGIQSIDLNYLNINFFDANGNHHQQISTVTMADETIVDIVDVWFVRDLTDTDTEDKLSVSEDIARLPDIRGFGSVHSLHQAMVRDSTGQLKNLLEQFAAEKNDTVRRNLVPQILYRWSGGNTNIRAMEAFIGERYNGGTGHNAMGVLNNAFNHIADTVYSILMAQTHYRHLYAAMVPIGNDHEKIIYDMSNAAYMIIAEIMNDSESDINLLIDYMMNIYDLALRENFDFSGFRDILAKENVLYGYIADMIKKNTFIGTRGNDTVRGTNGNDAYWYEFGTNTIDGGNGDNTYFFGRNFGTISIIDTSGDNTIVFLSGIKRDDLCINRVAGTTHAEITVDGASGKIVIRNASKFYRLVFMDGDIYDLIEVLPYKDINTAEQLDEIRLDLRNFYRLTTDIDMVGTDFIPLGTNSLPFSGIFNGNGYTISNLNVNRPNLSFNGLFGVSNGNIVNAKLQNVSISGRNYSGSLVGQNNGNISGCSINNILVSGSSYIGGLTGENTGFIEKSSVIEGQVTGTSNYAGGIAGLSNGIIKQTGTNVEVRGSAFAGGFAGRAANAIIAQCYTTGNVQSSNSSSSNIGGFTGNVSGDSLIQNSYSRGNVVASGSISTLGAGFAGNIDNGVRIENCYAISSNPNGFSSNNRGVINNCYFYNGFYFDNTDPKGRSLEEMMMPGTYIGWDTNIWSIEKGRYPVLYAVKDVDSGSNYMEISTIAELNSIRNNMFGDYRLIADIDLENIEWMPIGTTSSPFTGTFDGNGYTISNLNVNRPNLDFNGLFGLNNGSIKNLKLTDVTISGRSYTGSLAGRNNGAITGVLANSISISGNSYTGGLVGDNSGVVEQCLAAKGQVTGFDRYVGGIAGRLNGTIRQSGANVEVIGSSYSGGFVGGAANGSLIQDSYARGNVTGSVLSAAGFAGAIEHDNVRIENSYAISFNFNGFSSNDRGTITNCYYYNVFNLFNTDLKSRSIQEMKTPDTYIDWDTDIWLFETGKLPTLYAVEDTYYSDILADNYVEISTRAELIAINDNLLGNYRLIADIDLGNIAWTPIGTNSSPFAGIFDGNGYTISNLNINRPSSNDVGLFGVNSGVILNAKLMNVTISGGNYVGSLAGRNNGGIGFSSANNISISGNNYLGGLIGDNAGVVVNSLAYWGQVVSGRGNHIGGLAGNTSGRVKQSGASVNVSGAASVGGFTGAAGMNSTIEECYAIGNVIVISANGSAGGFVGKIANNSSISNSYARGSVIAADINSNSSAAGFAGFIESDIVKIENCYSASSHRNGFAVENRTGITNCYFDNDVINGVNPDLRGRTTNEMKTPDTYVGWDDNIWIFEPGQYPVLNAVTEINIKDREFISITTTAQLIAVSQNLSGNYRLMANIDLRNTSWTPIGTDTSPFTGIFDGNGFTISNLNVNRPNSHYSGLFGLNAGRIENLKLNNVVIVSRESMGSIAGENKGTIKNCSVTNVSISGSRVAGGLVGGNSGLITNCFVSGGLGVTGTGFNIGGLTGTTTGRIRQSGTNINVSGSYWTGGLAGQMSGAFIEQCYATGSVSGADAGGLVGYVDSDSIIRNSYAWINEMEFVGRVERNGFLSIENCYFISTNPYGFSYDSNINISNSYFDNDVISNINTSSNGRSTKEMKTPETYAGWDAAIWLIEAGAYPTLIAVPDMGPVYTEISTAAQLRAVNQNLSGNYRLVSDIDLRNEAWIPIGTNTTPFWGIFDGNGYTISNLYYPGSDNAGLFGVNRGSILNLNFDNVVISGQNNAGSIAGNNRGALRNLTVSNITISGRDYVGGLVGNNAGLITGCLVRWGPGVSGTGSYIGGLAGNTSGRIMKSGTNVNVDGANYVGGFVGNATGTNAILEQCYATGDVNGLDFVGGFIGSASNRSVMENCYAKGNTAANNNTGGFAGYIVNNTVKFENCYTISNNPNGFNFNNNGIIISCYFDNEVINGSNNDAKGRSTKEIKTPSTYINWDGNIWNFSSGEYPVLNAVPEIGIPQIEFMTVSTVAELSAINQNLSGNYRLIANINLADVAWIPLGASNEPFIGIFDGNGHTISNLDINRPDLDYAGLFGVSNGSIFDLKLKSGTITGRDYVGSIVGNNTGIVENCSVNSLSVNGRNYVGGFAGSTTGVIKQSSTNANVKGLNYFGGFAGQITGAVVEQCHAAGNVGGTISGTPYAGGFAGLVTETSIIRNSYSKGVVVGTNFSAGFAGFIDSDDVKIENCYTTSPNPNGFNSNNRGTIVNCYFDKALIGEASTDVKGRSTKDMKAPGTYAGWDQTIWLIEAGEYPALRAVPEINNENIIDIGAAAQLDEIRHNPDGNYRLVADIDLGGTTWVPISTFHGMFDGNGHTISNIKVNQPSSNNSGLFGVNRGVIKNLKLQNVEMAGNNYVGGLAAFNTGIITNCSVEELSLSGSYYVGGLVGQNSRGVISNCLVSSLSINRGEFVGGMVGNNVSGAIANCSVSGGTLTGHSRIGGFVGASSSSSIIRLSNTDADVSGSSFVGGFAGVLNSGVIEQCFATGNADGTINISGIGGFVGYALSAVMRNCYALGNVTGGNDTAGFVGFNSGFTYENCYSASNHFRGFNASSFGTFINCYFDNEKIGGVSNDAKGRTTADMKQITNTRPTYVGWDRNIWLFTPGEYPTLRNAGFKYVRTTPLIAINTPSFSFIDNSVLLNSPLYIIFDEASVGGIWLKIEENYADGSVREIIGTPVGSNEESGEWTMPEQIYSNGAPDFITITAYSDSKFTRPVYRVAVYPVVFGM